MSKLHRVSTSAPTIFEKCTKRKAYICKPFPTPFSITFFKQIRMVRKNVIVISTVLLLFAMLLEPCQAGCYVWNSKKWGGSDCNPYPVGTECGCSECRKCAESADDCASFPQSSTCCATEKSNALCECNGQVRYGAGTQWSRKKAVRGSTECSTNAFGGDDPAPGVQKYCECFQTKVVLEWKSTTTTTPGWTLDESKSDKSEVDQSIWPKFETKKDSSTNANYDLLLFPAGTYTLVQSDGRSSSNDNNVNVWLGSQAAVDPHATHASGFVAMIMQGVAPWNGWPSFTDYYCLSPHVSTKCADSPRVDAVTFTLIEPTWLRPVYSNHYNAHGSRCRITLTFRPLSETVPWGSYYFMAANSPGSVCPALGAFDIASSTECQQYASAHLGKAFKQVVANENEPNGCFYRKVDDDILWNTAGTAVGAGNGAGRNRLLVCKGGTLYMLLNVRSVHVCTGWYPGKASVGTMIILFELRLSCL